MNILIVYTSRHGTTRTLVEALVPALAGSVDIIDLRWQTMPNLDRYQMVLLGGPIYSGAIPAPFKHFCEIHKNQLLARKVGLFISCISLFKRADRYLKSAFPKWLLEHAFARELLGGKIALKSIDPFQRLLLNLVSGVRKDRDNLNPEALSRLINAANRA